MDKIRILVYDVISKYENQVIILSDTSQGIDMEAIFKSNKELNIATFELINYTNTVVNKAKLDSDVGKSFMNEYIDKVLGVYGYKDNPYFTEGDLVNRFSKISKLLLDSVEQPITKVYRIPIINISEENRMYHIIGTYLSQAILKVIKRLGYDVISTYEMAKGFNERGKQIEANSTMLEVIIQVYILAIYLGFNTDSYNFHLNNKNG